MTMGISPKPGKGLRSKIARIAAAIAFALTICSVAAGTARADDHGRHDDRGGHDRGWRGPNVYVAPEPDYYYQPPPDYYDAPEPDYYYPPEQPYYQPDQPEYYPPPPSEGIHLFFGL
jgi:hypothetical protein